MNKAYTLYDGRAVAPEGAMVVPVALDFTSNADGTFVLDIGQFVALTRMTQIQSIIADMLDAPASDGFVIESRTNQRFRCLAGLVNFFHFPVPNPGTLTFQAGNLGNPGKGTFYLCNFPIPGITQL